MQKILFYSKDNQIIVADVDFTGYTLARKKAELQRMQHYYAQYDYVDLYQNFYNRSAKPNTEKNLLSLIDDQNTHFVNHYVKSFDYVKNRSAYRNSVGTNNFPNSVRKMNTLHFDCSLDDSAVPEFIKNLGFEIIPKDVSKDIDVDDQNFMDEFNKTKVRMDVSSTNRRIRVFRYHYTFTPADHARLRRLITDYNSLSPRPDIKEYCSQMDNCRDRKLFNVYTGEILFTQNKEAFAHHEFHHIKNRMVFQGILCKPNVKRLTAENTYRLEVENERSAYLSQTIEAINRYLRGGNFNDYSMFDDYTKNLPEKLKAMTNAQKVSYLTDMNNIVNSALKHFESSRRDYYDENQFPNTTETSLLWQPVDAPEDLNGEQYRLIRSAYYSISVYNPATGKEEIRNLSKYIKPENEVQINAEQMQNIVEPAKERLNEKIEEYNADLQKPKIEVTLLDEARAFYRAGMRTPRIISDAQTINVADLLEGKPQPDEFISSATPPTQIPADNTGWSDDLQKYWSRFDGYNELAKNNLEYSFAIKNQEVRYTSKDKVSMSKSCEYEMYERLVKEPSGAKKAIYFEKTLSEDQALMLYVACINNGRRMRGAVPRDLSKIDTLTTIPKTERDKFKAKITPPSSYTSSAFSVSLPLNARIRQ